MTEIVQYVPPPTTSEIGTIVQVAEQISRTGMVPSAFRGKPDDILAAALYGREIGLGMMAALQRIVVINGKPTLDAQGMGALIRRAGHSLTGEADANSATVHGKRGDTGDELTFTFTIQMARDAGLVKGGPWKQYPHAMLWARAVTQIARMLFPDVLSGFSYSPEEIGGDVPEHDLPEGPPDIPIPSGPSPHGPVQQREQQQRVLTAVPDTDDDDEVVDAVVVDEPAPREPVKLNKSFFAAWKITMKGMDMDAKSEHASLEAIFGDKAKGDDGYSIKYVDPDMARAMLKALKEGANGQSADEKQTAFVNRGVALLADRHTDDDLAQRLQDAVDDAGDH